MIKINVINNTNNELPKYANESDVGMDLRANLEHPVRIPSNHKALIPSGIAIELPKGYQAEVRSRSGLGIKYGVSVLGGVGTIDPAYKGEIGVVLINQGEETFVVKNNMRIAQLVFSKFESVELVEVEVLNGENRGGGFGSTGI